ncbi:uncharacterized protein EMH_0038310 [Eimeria mitis]|uniref:Prolyl 4-hydroxylase alpha subunit Fe(2+) 2OG dioxygenase domain-containing protein n=1 Tax=Eimeria mitis TaxID=44415 RepID=U6KKA6_9EIME|nr:uncharacterized protein EMH_0038310 [Eimeria mitis]CDJ35868.1 hypothetical protein EMH_0038310 [Eimeria mitis]
MNFGGLFYFVLIFALDVEEGGYTHFTRLGLKIGPSQGSAVLWSNVTPTGQVDFRTMHAGVSPTKGTKYVVNCFFNEAVVRHEKPPALLPLEPPQGIPDFQQQRTGAGSPPPAETGKNTAMRDSVNANGRFPPHTEHSQPQQLQQQQLETSKIWGSQHRPVWGLPGTEARGKQTFCPAVLFSLPQQQLQQHAMPHGTVYPTPGWMVGGAKLPGAPVGLPFTATGSPPAGWRSHAAGSLPLDQRWM